MHGQYEEMPNNPLLPSMTMAHNFNISIETIFQTDNFSNRHDSTVTNSYIIGLLLSTLNLTDYFKFGPKILNKYFAQKTRAIANSIE